MRSTMSSIRIVRASSRMTIAAAAQRGSTPFGKNFRFSTVSYTTDVRRIAGSCGSCSTSVTRLTRVRSTWLTSASGHHGPSGHQGVCLSIINCAPSRAAFLIIGHLLSGSQVEVHISGAPEPIRMILEGEFGDPKSTELNGTAPNGDEFSMEYDTIKHITLA